MRYYDRRTDLGLTWEMLFNMRHHADRAKANLGDLNAAYQNRDQPGNKLAGLAWELVADDVLATINKDVARLLDAVAAALELAQDATENGTTVDPAELNQVLIGAVLRKDS